jgi:Uncharacterized conserved protein (DUF2163)
MPKIITPAMRAHLDAETTRLATIWRLTRKDGQQFFFTDHDGDIVFGGEVYRADAGFERTAIRSDAGFAVDNLDLVGVFAEGFARTALPDTDLPFQTDLASQLHLTMVSGSLASVSNVEMLNGANLAALIRADGNAELIQFQDSALSLGVYTLTTLLRGRRGTEVFTGGYAVGDLLVLLDGDGVTRRPLGLDRLGDMLHYRTVGRGGELRDARTAPLTLAGNDLKPYAPAQLKRPGAGARTSRCPGSAAPG